MTAPFFDSLFFGIIAFSGFIGVLRGITREVLGIMGWVGAVFVSVVSMPFVRPFARDYIQPPMLADGIVMLVLFIVSLSFLIALSRWASSHIKRSVLGGVDRSLGLLFGLARGLALLSLAYLGYGFFAAPKDQPQWLQEAKTRPWLIQGSEILKNILPPDLFEAALKHKGDLEPAVDKAQQIERVVDELSKLKPKTTPSKSDSTPVEHTP